MTRYVTRSHLPATHAGPPAIKPLPMQEWRDTHHRQPDRPSILVIPLAVSLGLWIAAGVVGAVWWLR